VLSPIDGQITTWDVDKTLFRRSVQLGSVLMRVVEPNGDWELELLMPEDRMGFINEACRELKTEQLPVHYITQTNPGVTHEGNVAEIHHTAEIRGEEGNTVMLRVAINKDDVPDRRDAAAVTAKVYCGRTSLGYAWFHDLVSFVQSKILFRLF
jgi:hypothetical protein